MSSFEIGYCTYEEYRSGETGRVRESELAIGGLYTVMFTLDATSAIPAAKFPSRIVDVLEDQSQMFGVKFTILNADLAPDFETLSVFRNGYWLPAHSQGIRVGQAPVIAGYFKESYGADSPEQELQDIIEFEQTKLREQNLVAC